MRALILSLLLLLAAAVDIAAAEERGWDRTRVPPREQRRARRTGAAFKNMLCLVTDCEKANALPTTRPGGPYADFGPYDTRLVEIDASRTIMYGFSGALVACPVTASGRAAPLPNQPAAFKNFNLGGNGDDATSAPGVSWSYGGDGDCAGLEGIANSVDGFGPEWYGEQPDFGYWLPELLEHFASWGMVTACPYLRGIPDGSAGAMATVNAARMLADLQPCAGVTVDRAKLGVAGYSLGAGRAVRGAAMVPNAVKAVVALHTWELVNANYDAKVQAPLMLLSGTDDTNAPFENTLRTYRAATGPKIVGALRGGNHYTSPRFWVGVTTAFLRTHLAGDSRAERYAWGDGGLGFGSEIMTWQRRDCDWWRSQTVDACKYNS